MSNARGGLDGFATSFADWVLKLRYLVIPALIAAAAFLASGAQYLGFDSNYRTFFSKLNPELTAFEEFQQVYVKSDNIVFLIIPKTGGEAFTRDALEASATITERGWGLPYASRVDSLNNFQNTRAEGDDLIVADLIPDVAALDEAGVQSARAAALAEPLLRNQLIAESGKAIAVNVTINFPEAAPNEVPETVAAARALRDEIRAAHPDLDIRLSGTTMLNNAFEEAVKQDLTTLVPAMMLVIFVAVGIALRSLSLTLSVVIVIGLSAAAAMGAAGFAGIRLAGPSPSAPIVILTLAVADSIHVLMSARRARQRGLDKRAAIVEAMRSNFLAVAITSLTTVIGFLALNFSESPPFRDFGNIIAVGVFLAWALSITLLPALALVLPWRAPSGRAEDSETGRSLMGRFGAVVVPLAFPLMLAVGAGAIWLGAQIPKLELKDSFRTYFNQRIEFRRDTDESLDHFGFYQIEFSVPAGASGAVSEPSYLQTLDEFTQWLRAYEGARHVASIADIMKRLNRNLNADDPAYYRLPDDRELSAQYLLLYELSLPYGLDLNDRINIDKSATRVTVLFDGRIDTALIRRLVNDADAWFSANAPAQNAKATGATVMFTYIAERNVRSMVQGTIIAVVAIGLVMMAALQSWRMGLLSLLPNAAPIIAAFGVWALLFGEIGFSVAAVASISLGIVIDDTTHFLAKYMRGRRERGLDGKTAVLHAFDTVGAPILATTLILLAGFLMLTFSAFKINYEMGLLTSLTIAIALVFDFLFLPGLLLLFGWRRRSVTASGDDSHA